MNPGERRKPTRIQRTEETISPVVVQAIGKVRAEKYEN